MAEGIALCKLNLAQLMLQKKDWEQAEKFALQSLPLSEKLGRLQLIAAGHLALAEALLGQNPRSEASPHAVRAVELYEKLGSAPVRKRALTALTECQAEES